MVIVYRLKMERRNCVLVSLVYARDGIDDKRLGAQWIAALLYARAVGDSVFLCCGTFAFQLTEGF